jgi:hypothetical protein
MMTSKLTSKPKPGGSVRPVYCIRHLGVLVGREGAWRYRVTVTIDYGLDSKALLAETPPWKE